VKPPVPARGAETGQYTQINILFPSNDAELPSADRLKAFHRMRSARSSTDSSESKSSGMPG